MKKTELKGKTNDNGVQMNKDGVLPIQKGGQPSLSDKEREYKRIFTEKEIFELQHEVHKITGDGEVMQLFNGLLGIAAG